MSLRYSPLCDTDRVAYLAYCYSHCHGSSVDVSERFDGVDGVEGRKCGSVDDGGVVKCVDDSVDSSWRAWMVGLRRVAADDGIVGGFGRGVCDARGVGLEGVSGNNRDFDVGGIGDCVGDVGGSRDGGLDESKAGLSHAPVLGDGSDGCKVGPNGGVSVGRGVNYERNLVSRLKKKKKRVEAQKESTVLQRSLEARWQAENELAVAQAKRKLLLLESRDLEAEKRMQRVQIMKTTESAKVQTERAYATLRRTGNVPGFAETVVTDGSCPALSPDRSDGTCISPDSSVSQQEIRAMMKELEDYKLTLERIERDNPALVAHHMEGHGVKTAFTLDSDGMCPVDEPGCMGIDGKYHLDSYERNPKFYKDRFRAEEATERYFNRE